MAVILLSSCGIEDVAGNATVSVCLLITVLAHSSEVLRSQRLAVQDQMDGSLVEQSAGSETATGQMSTDSITLVLMN